MRNINQFQSVYSFLIAPIYFLSGIFFPLGAGSVLGIISYASPFAHGVILLQHCAWGTLTLSAFLIHTAALFAFTLVLGAWSLVRIQKRLIS